jgi:tetratricopeptide (TPR) repeat protein
VEEALDDLLGHMLDVLIAQAAGALAVLHALLAFPGGALEPHLRAVVTGGADASDEAAIEFRDTLLKPAEDAGLISQRGERYDLDPPVVRAYIERRRPPAPAVLADYCLGQAAALLPIVQDYDDAIRSDRMTYSTPLEWANVAAALDWLAQAAPQDDQAARLLLDYRSAARNTLHNNYDPRLQGWLDVALPAARRLDDQWGEANVLQAIGDVQQFRTEMDAALRSYEQALALFRAVGSKLGEANVLRAIGDVQQFRTEMDAALRSYEQALALYRAVGDRLGEANVLAAQSRLLIDAEPEQAALLIEQAVQQHQAIGSIYDVGADLGNYGMALLDCGRAAEALPYLRRARALFAQINAEQYVAIVDESRRLKGEAQLPCAGGVVGARCAVCPARAAWLVRDARCALRGRRGSCA